MSPNTSRASGILLHITSLPDTEPVGPEQPLTIARDGLHLVEGAARVSDLASLGTDISRWKADGSSSFLTMNDHTTGLIDIA